MTALLYIPDLTVGTIVIELENLSVVGSVDGKGQMATINHQRSGDGQQSQSSNQNSLTQQRAMALLIDHGVPRNERKGKSDKFLLDPYT